MRKFKRRFCRKVAMPLVVTAIAASTVLAPAVSAFAEGGNDPVEEHVEEKVEEKVEVEEEEKEAIDENEGAVPEPKTQSAAPKAIIIGTSEEADETSDPKPVKGLVYDGKNHALCEPGSNEGSEYQYRTDLMDDWSTEIPIGNNAGMTTVYWREMSGGEEVQKSFFDVTIEKAKISEIRKVSDKQYNGSFQTLSGADLEVVTENGVEVPVICLDIKGDVTEVNAGTYGFTVGIRSFFKKNYDTSIVLAGEYTIAKKELTNDMIKADSLTLEADNTWQGPDFTVTDINQGLNIITDSDYEISGDTEAKYIGNYTASFTATEDGNYTGAVDVDWNIVAKGVKKAPGAINRTYDGTSKNLITEGELKDKSATMVYKLSTDLYATTDVPVATDAGTYVVEYGCMNKGQFEKLGEVKVTVAKAEIDSVSFVEKDLVYNAQVQGYDKTDVTVTTANGINVSADEFNIYNNKETKAGEYTLEVKAKEGSKNFCGEASNDWSIGKATLEVADMIADDKIYDGNIFAKADAKDAVLTGIKDGDVVFLDNVSQVFEDENAGVNKDVVFIYTNAGLIGPDASNYQLDTTAAPKNGKATIEPKEINEVDEIRVNKKTYDGTDSAEINPWSAELPQVVEGDSVSIYDITGSFGDANAGVDKEVKLDYSEAKLGGMDAVNYIFVPNEEAQRFALGTISPKQLQESMITVEGNFTWDGEEKFPTITVKDVVEGVGNIITEKDIVYNKKAQKDVGTYTLTIGTPVDGNYTGNVEVSWVIKPVGSFEYDIIEDGEIVYNKNSEDNGIILKANGPAEKFLALLIDDVQVDDDNYIVYSGSTVVAVTGEYLDTLTAGEHTYSFVYEDGMTNAGTFTVKGTIGGGGGSGGNSDVNNGTGTQNTASASTGDYTRSETWSTVLMISAVAVGASCIIALKIRKKQK